jgi:hypothetical protein
MVRDAEDFGQLVFEPDKNARNACRAIDKISGDGKRFSDGESDRGDRTLPVVIKCVDSNFVSGLLEQDHLEIPL